MKRGVVTVIYIIDDILEEMAIEERVHFSPHYVCTRAGIDDLKSVTEYLLKLVGQKLIVNFEVECPEGDSDFAVKTPQELRNEERACHICGKEYVPNPDRVWIIFDFIPEYKEYVKKKNIKRQLILV